MIFHLHFTEIQNVQKRILLIGIPINTSKLFLDTGPMEIPQKLNVNSTHLYLVQLTKKYFMFMHLVVGPVYVVR